MANDSIITQLLDSGTVGRLFLVLGLVIGYTTCLALYRLYFHPLASIPGPKIAAITALYAMYHDIIIGGTYIWVIEDMHKKYGPIVRIRPNTVHINDARFLDQVYGVAGSRRNKSKLHCNALMTPEVFVATSEHDLHRARRAPISPFFSKQSIRRLEPILQRCLGKILARMELHATNNTPLDPRLLFNASTNDVITEYSFGNCWNNLDVPDLNERFFQVMIDGPKMWHVSSYFPFLMKFFTSIPEKMAIWLAPDMEILLPHFAVLEKQIEDIRASKRDGSLSIFQALLDSKLPESEKSTERLFCESRVLLAAGTDTTGMMLTRIVFHLLSNPAALKRLKKELETAIPDPSIPPTSAQVENLPYFTAIIEETLRLHPGGSMRQERYAPEEDLVYINDEGTKYFLPRGTNMAMTAPLLSRNEELYPEPNVWRLERFLENPHLDKYSLVFSRGPRICLGMNLAYSELYIITAGIFRKYDVYDGTGRQKGPTLELYESTREDIDMATDFAVPFIKEGRKGVRVIVRH